MPRKKFDFEKYLTKQLEAVGAEKLKERYYLINGWRIKFNRSGVYWHNKVVDEFANVTDGPNGKYIEKANKPYTSKVLAKQKVIDHFVDRLSNHKTAKEIRREERQQKAAEKQRNFTLQKRHWCNYPKPCEFSSHGQDSPKCKSMKFSEEIGHFWCANKEWYEWAWCYNAKVDKPPKDKPWAISFTCSKTKEPCPYQKTIMPNDRAYLSNDKDGKHYTTCDYYDGHRINETLVIERRSTYTFTEATEEPQKKSVKRKTTGTRRRKGTTKRRKK